MENERLIADERAARESTRLKSQFLANVGALYRSISNVQSTGNVQMSHEIRTPIA